MYFLCVFSIIVIGVYMSAYLRVVIALLIIIYTIALILLYFLCTNCSYCYPYFYPYQCVCWLYFAVIT